MTTRFFSAETHRFTKIAILIFLSYILLGLQDLVRYSLSVIPEFLDNYNESGVDYALRVGGNLLAPIFLLLTVVANLRGRKNLGFLIALATLLPIALGRNLFNFSWEAFFSFLGDPTMLSWISYSVLFLFTQLLLAVGYVFLLLGRPEINKAVGKEIAPIK